MKLLENITSYILLSSKLGQMAFGPTIFPFLELLQINRKETSSEAPPKHMHITNTSFKQNEIFKAYVYDVTK